MIESGFSDPMYQVTAGFVLMAPPNIPLPIRNRLEAGARAAVA
ncbi:MAG: hypothetical protein JWQ16_3515, partial [Novosphingobium sp.]|nr:hypothetical protein [Novosphingobium sp.]